MLNQPTAKDGSNRSSDGRKARPCANRLAPTFLIERSTDDCKAARDQECGPDTLNAPGDDQLMNVCRNPAAHRGCGENCHTKQEYPAATEQVAERAPDQNQRA